MIQTADTASLAIWRARAHIAVVRGRIIPQDYAPLVELSRRVGRLTVLLGDREGATDAHRVSGGEFAVEAIPGRSIRLRRRHPLLRDETTDLFLPFGLVRRLRQLQPDAVYAHELGLRTCLSVSYAYRHRLPLVVGAALSEHTEIGRGWARQWLRRWIARRAGAGVCNGTSGTRYLARLGFDPNGTFHVPYIPLSEAIAAGPCPRGPEIAYRLLYVGRLIELKGLGPFLDVLSRRALARPGQHIEFLLAGDGPLRKQLAAMPLPANLQVTWLGQQSPEQLASLYRKSGIFVFPSLSDEWGMVVHEAMASGLPVLGSVYSQAVCDLVENGRSGWTFRTDADNEMAKALDTALDTPAEQLIAMREAARQRVAHLTLDYAVTNLVTALETAAARVRLTAGR